MVKLSGIQHFIIYLTAFFLILDNGTIYTHLPGLSIIDVIVTFFPIISLSILTITRVKKYLSEGNLFSLLVLDFFLIFYLLISTSNEKVSLLTLVLFNFLIVYYISFEQRNSPLLLNAYRNIIVVIAVTSMIFWIGGSILNVIAPTGTIMSTWGASTKDTFLNNYYWLYFEGDDIYFMGQWIIDNRSIFTERAFASYSFMIGLIYELFLEEKQSKIRILIFLFSIISTTSTTGVISAIIAFFFFLKTRVNNKKYIKIFSIVVFPIMLVFVYYSIVNLIQSRASMGHSSESRSDDFTNGVVAWLKSPVFGYGFANHDKLAKLGTGYSNSVTQILCQGGLMLTFLYLLSFIRCFSRSIHFKQYNVVYFMLSFLVFFTTTGIATRNTILYLMIFFFVGCSNKENYYRKEMVKI